MELVLSFFSLNMYLSLSISTQITYYKASYSNYLTHFLSEVVIRMRLFEVVFESLRKNDQQGFTRSEATVHTESVA